VDIIKTDFREIVSMLSAGYDRTSWTRWWIFEYHKSR